jgi:hypothetical protein
MLNPYRSVTVLVSARWAGDSEHPSLGLRVVGDGRLFFRPEWTEVTVELPDREDPATVPITASFWGDSPDLRSPELANFLKRHRLEDWPTGHPPHFNLEPLGEGRFRLEFLTESGVIGR